MQLLALPNGTTGTPTSGTGGSYMGTGDVLVASFALNYNSLTTGETINDLSSLPLTNLTYTTFGTGSNTYSAGVYTLTTGEKLELRFYSGITYTSATNYDTSSPPASTKYNQVRSDTLEGGDPLETTWIVPASGSVDLDYNTISDSGPYANATGYASLTVAAAGVPEPSTYVGGLVGCILTLAAVRGSKNSRKA